MNTTTVGETKQLTPRIRLEHVNGGFSEQFRQPHWTITVDNRAPEHFISREDAITFARGVDIGHASTEREAHALLKFVHEHVLANANCVPLHALFRNDDTSFQQAVRAYFENTNGGGVKATELLSVGGTL